MQHPLKATLDAQERNGYWLAKKTGKSPSYVHRIIHYERTPSADFQERASLALGVPVALLFPDDAPTEAAS